MGVDYPKRKSFLPFRTNLHVGDDFINIHKYLMKKHFATLQVSNFDPINSTIN